MLLQGLRHGVYLPLMGPIMGKYLIGKSFKILLHGVYLLLQGPNMGKYLIGKSFKMLLQSLKPGPQGLEIWGLGLFLIKIRIDQGKHLIGKLFRILLQGLRFGDIQGPVLQSISMSTDLIFSRKNSHQSIDLTIYGLIISI